MIIKKNKIVALIPARKGSIGIKNKNIKLFNGHPLVAYSISAAKLIKDVSDISKNPDLVLKTFDKLPKKMRKELAENKKKFTECGKENKCFEISRVDYERILSEMEDFKEKIQKVRNESNNPLQKKAMEISIKKFDELLEKLKKSIKESSKDKSKSQKKKRSGNKK